MRPRTVALVGAGSGALPNGNTTDQTIGRALQPGDDWHFDIQHIGAQTRFLRAQGPERPLVVAYLEATGRSWPAWRRGHGTGSAPIPGLVEAVRQRFGDRPVRLTLSGHSGGGSVVLGYLDAVERNGFIHSLLSGTPAENQGYVLFGSRAYSSWIAPAL